MEVVYGEEAQRGRGPPFEALESAASSSPSADPRHDLLPSKQELADSTGAATLRQWNASRSLDDAHEAPALPEQRPSARGSLGAIAQHEIQARCVMVGLRRPPNTRCASSPYTTSISNWTTVECLRRQAESRGTFGCTLPSRHIRNQPAVLMNSKAATACVPLLLQTRANAKSSRDPHVNSHVRRIVMWRGLNV